MGTKINVNKIDLFRGIFAGDITPFKLPKNLYKETADALNKALYKGYDGTLIDFAFNSPDHEMLTELRTNIYMFSGAKTFQQTLEMSDALVKDGEYVPFKQFKEAATHIFEKYNANWLAAEYDTAIESARSAAKWVDIERTVKYFPYLQYSAVMDGHTCPICAVLNGTVLPVNDLFWRKSMPPNHFRCECVVMQMDKEDAKSIGITPKEEVKRRQSDSEETKNPLFNFNPGIDKVVFQDTGRNRHPYFEIPKKYRVLAQNNFNLPIPDKE